VLILYFYENLNLGFTIQGLSDESGIIDIGANKHRHMVSQLPAAHVLSGCDTAAQCFGVGIKTILKVLNSGIHLNKLGDLSKDISDNTEEATVFMAACYGVRGMVNISEVFREVWSQKMSRTNVTKAPELKSLAPTNEAFEENIKRRHTFKLLF
jgi:hypothetical protein